MFCGETTDPPTILPAAGFGLLTEYPQPQSVVALSYACFIGVNTFGSTIPVSLMTNWNSTFGVNRLGSISEIINTSLFFGKQTLYFALRVFKKEETKRALSTIPII